MTQNYVPISLKKKKTIGREPTERSNNFLWQWSATIIINRKIFSQIGFMKLSHFLFLQHSLKSLKYSFQKLVIQSQCPHGLHSPKEQHVLKGRTSSQLSLSCLSKSGPFLVDFYMGHNTYMLSSKSSKNHSSKKGTLITFFSRHISLH